MTLRSAGRRSPEATGNDQPQAVPECSRLAELGRNWPLFLGSALGIALGAALYPVYLMPLLGLEVVRTNGWQWADWAFVLTLMNIAGLISVLLSGRIIDAFGPRWPAAISTGAMGLVLSAAPFAHSLEAWRAGCVVFAIAGLATGPVVYARTISDAFVASRGLVLGIMFGSVGLTGAIVPSALLALIARVGTQQALQFLGIGYILILAPLIAFLLRHARRPATSPGSQLASILAPEIAKLMRWMRTGRARMASLDANDRVRGGSSLARSGWIALTLGFVMLCTAAFGTAVSLPDLARHLRSASPVALMAALSLAVMVSRPLSGLLLDFAPAQFVAAVLAGATGAGLFAIAAAPRLLFMGAVLAGVSLGTEVNILAFLVARYADPLRQSRTYARIFFLVGSVMTFSPSIFAKGHALAGSYAPVLKVAGAAALVAALLIGTVTWYSRPSPQRIQETDA